jgi:hypothetical protein
VIGVLALLLAGCSTFNEKHYFHSVDTVSGRPVNYFRVTIKGSSTFTRSRYISGYYDERAVDLFFNEIKPTSDGDVKKIFLADQTAPGTTEKVVPLAPENGTFLMIFSTNAKSVTDTLGQFAESQVVADAVTNLLNRGQIRAARESAAKETTKTGEGKAFAALVEKIITELPNDAAADVAKDQTLRALRQIAAALGSDGQFKDLDEAQAWFKAQRESGNGGGK